MHHHHHSHSTDNIRMAFWLNITFTVIEIGGGLYTNSLAVLSDALHDFGDSLALGLAWYFAILSNKDRDESFSFGYGRFSVLGAFISSLILVVGSIFIVTEAIPRIIEPEPAKAEGMFLLAILGVLVNGAAVMRLKKGTSLNEQVMSWHLLEDVLGWVAVLIVSIVMMFYDVPILDPILSMGIAIYIMMHALKGLRKSLFVLLQGIPEGLSLPIITAGLTELDPHISGVHDFHLWTMDGEFHIASFHLDMNVTPSASETVELKKRVRVWLKETHQVEHATIEIHAATADCGMRDK